MYIPLTPDNIYNIGRVLNSLLEFYTVGVTVDTIFVNDMEFTWDGEMYSWRWYYIAIDIDGGLSEIRYTNT